LGKAVALFLGNWEEMAVREDVVADFASRAYVSRLSYAAKSDSALTESNFPRAR
jgi:hypothetical protein